MLPNLPLYPYNHILEILCVPASRQSIIINMFMIPGIINITILTFSGQICLKMDLGLKIQKTNVGIRMTILEILCVPTFRQNGPLSLFWLKFAQKWILGSEFQKSKCGFGISTFKIPCVQIFRLNRELWIFPPKFWEIAQLHVIFWY